MTCSVPKKREGNSGLQQNTDRRIPSVIIFASKSLPFYNGDGNFYIMGNFLSRNHIKQHVRSRISHLFHMIVHSRKLGCKILIKPNLIISHNTVIIWNKITILTERIYQIPRKGISGAEKAGLDMAFVRI